VRTEESVRRKFGWAAAKMGGRWDGLGLCLGREAEIDQIAVAAAELAVNEGGMNISFEFGR
jgi:hypothetical protein